MPPESSKLLVQVLRKIPIFKGLSPSQVKKILSICVHKSYKPGSQICRSNTPSDEMYILLSGELAVVTSEGIRVATILPVTTVGEMGVITGQPRSATVEACKPCNIFAIQKVQFDTMLREDRDMRGIVYRNIIDVLSDKLSNDNVRIRDYKVEKDRLEGRLSVLERQLEKERQRARLAVEMAAESSGLSADEIDLRIGEQIKDVVPRLLIVDDEADFRRLLRDALPAFEVVEAEDGQQALEKLQEEKVDLVITDIRMPNMDGPALLQNLRGHFPGLPVLAVSGFIDAEQVKEYDFDGFIEKPVSLDRMRELVEETMGRKKEA